MQGRIGMIKKYHAEKNGGGGDGPNQDNDEGLADGEGPAATGDAPLEPPTGSALTGT